MSSREVKFVPFYDVLWYNPVRARTTKLPREADKLITNPSQCGILREEKAKQKLYKEGKAASKNLRPKKY